MPYFIAFVLPSGDGGFDFGVKRDRGHDYPVTGGTM